MLTVKRATPLINYRSGVARSGCVDEQIHFSVTSKNPDKRAALLLKEKGTRPFLLKSLQGRKRRSPLQSLSAPKMTVERSLCAFSRDFSDKKEK